MKFVWDFEIGKKENEKMPTLEELIENGNGFYGTVRTGNVCYDIIHEEWYEEEERKLILQFHCYVGGIDEGYGYSNKAGYENYPYAERFGATYDFEEPLENYTVKEFKECVEGILTQIIEEENLTDKANEELKLW